MTAVEPVDLADLWLAGMTFNWQTADALTRLVMFAAEVMTQAGTAALHPHLESLCRGASARALMSGLGARQFAQLLTDSRPAKRGML